MAPTGITLFGFRLRLQAEPNAAPEPVLLGRMPRSRPPRNCALTLRFVRPESLHTAEFAPRIAGRDYVLFPERRLLRVAAPPGLPERVLRERWVRLAVFALSLLAETYAPRRGEKRFVLSLHASAVAGPRGALAFCGHSTYGKSTLATQLLRGHRLLEDDLVFVLCPALPSSRARPRVCDLQGFVEEGLGRGAAPRSNWELPLAGLFWLKKAPRCGLEPLRSAEAAAHLLSPVLAGPSPAASAHRLVMLRQLLAQQPCLRLEFRKERAPLTRLLRRAGYL